MTLPATAFPVLPLLHIASSNSGKIAEFRLGLRLWREREGQSLDWRVEPVPEIGRLPECIEDGDTFSANARKKVRHYSRYANGLVLGDDSGLEVDALGGAPGIYSRRFAGPAATDVQNNAKLLQEMRGVPVTHRGAQFVCVLALARGGEVVAEFQGIARGILLDSPHGENGFGYDPLFLDPECQKTFAELTSEEKLVRSHRGKALQSMFAWLGRKPSQSES